MHEIMFIDNHRSNCKICTRWASESNIDYYRPIFTQTELFANL